MTNRPQKFQETSRPCFLSVSLPFLSPLPSGYGRKKEKGKGKRESCGFGPIPEAKVSSSHTSSTSPKKEEDEGAKRNSRLAVAGAKKREEEGLSIFLHVVVAESLPSPPPPPPRSIPQLRFYHERGLAGGGKEGRRGGEKEILDASKKRGGRGEGLFFLVPN